MNGFLPYQCLITPAVQHAHAVDAAARPQDRRFLNVGFARLLYRSMSGGATDGQPVGPLNYQPGVKKGTASACALDQPYIGSEQTANLYVRSGTMVA
jgi:hypothetical protein